MRKKYKFYITFEAGSDVYDDLKPEQIQETIREILNQYDGLLWFDNVAVIPWEEVRKIFDIFRMETIDVKAGIIEEGEEE